MSSGWYVLFHNSNFSKSLASAIQRLSAEVYLPARVRLFPRKNRPSPQNYEVALFPSYMFLRFDFTEVHFSQITALPGVHRFVQFSDSGPVLVPDEKITAIKLALDDYRVELLKKAPAIIEMHPCQRTPSYQEICFVVRENSAVARSAAWLALMQAGDAASRAKAKRPAMKMAY